MIIEISDKYDYNTLNTKTISIDTKFLPVYMKDNIKKCLKECDFFNLKSEPLDTVENPRYYIIRVIDDGVFHEVVSVLELMNNYIKIYPLFCYFRTCHKEVEFYIRNY